MNENSLNICNLSLDTFALELRQLFVMAAKTPLVRQSAASGRHPPSVGRLSTAEPGPKPATALGMTPSPARFTPATPSVTQRGPNKTSKALREKEVGIHGNSSIIRTFCTPVKNLMNALSLYFENFVKRYRLLHFVSEELDSLQDIVTVYSLKKKKFM